MLFDGVAKCDQSAWTACVDTYDGPAHETCIPSCEGSYNKETELRPYEICYMSCQVEAGNDSCACGAAAGCAGTKSCCMTACTTDYVSCLRGITSDDLSDVAACRPDYFQCVNNGCF